MPQLIADIVAIKKWISAFGVNVPKTENSPLLESLLKDCKEYMSKEKASGQEEGSSSKGKALYWLNFKKRVD